jgi:hypothetical protein
MDFSMYFLQMSAGCIGLAPVVPWRAVGKGYYVMMLSIGLGLLAVALLFRFSAGPGGILRGGDLMEEGWLLLYGLTSLAALGLFLGGRGEVGARFALSATYLGGAAVVSDVVRVLPGMASPAAGIALLAFNFVAGTLLLGSVLSAMLLGHWYLVVKDLPVEPLKTLTVLFFVALAARLVATVAAFALDPAGGSAVAHRSFLFVLIYGLFSLGTPMAMSWMVWGTVKIRSTQAATGILYGITVFILMGEAAGRFVLIKTGFPL